MKIYRLKSRETGRYVSISQPTGAKFATPLQGFAKWDGTAFESEQAAFDAVAHVQLAGGSWRAFFIAEPQEIGG